MKPRAIEAFNKTIIERLRYLKLEQKHNFVINKALFTAVNIYNNTIHSSTKIEPIKAFKFTKKMI